MSRKRNVANLKLEDFKGDPAAARNIGWRGLNFIAPATRIAKAQSEKYWRLGLKQPIPKKK